MQDFHMVIWVDRLHNINAYDINFIRSDASPVYYVVCIYIYIYVELYIIVEYN